MPAGPEAGATKPAMGVAGGGALAQRASVDVYAVVLQAGGYSTAVTVCSEPRSMTTTWG